MKTVTCDRCKETVEDKSDKFKDWVELQVEQRMMVGGLSTLCAQELSMRVHLCFDCSRSVRGDIKKAMEQPPRCSEPA